MKKNIETLLRIQEKDIEIYSLKKESQKLPQGLNVIKLSVEDLGNKVKERHEEIKKLQLKHKELEIELETKQENVKKYEIQLFQVKTNEEYKAMQKQINDLKFECGLLEDKILEKMEEIEKAQEGLRELEVALANEKNALAKREKEISAKIEAISNDIQEIQKQRDVLVQEVPGDFFNKYELIFNNKQGAALVSIENNACQGCHMALPPNVINEVKRGTKLIICDNCARILYYI